MSGRLDRCVRCRGGRPASDEALSRRGPGSAALAVAGELEAALGDDAAKDLAGAAVDGGDLAVAVDGLDPAVDQIGSGGGVAVAAQAVGPEGVDQFVAGELVVLGCLLYTSPSPRDS